MFIQIYGYMMMDFGFTDEDEEFLFESKFTDEEIHINVNNISFFIEEDPGEDRTLIYTIDGMIINADDNIKNIARLIKKSTVLLGGQEN